jgi:hypothetical protein
MESLPWVGRSSSFGVLVVVWLLLVLGLLKSIVLYCIVLYSVNVLHLRDPFVLHCHQWCESNFLSVSIRKHMAALKTSSHRKPHLNPRYRFSVRKWRWGMCMLCFRTFQLAMGSCQGCGHSEPCAVDVVVFVALFQGFDHASNPMIRMRKTLQRL